MRRVVIVQELLAQYRVPFYEALRPRLAEQDIDLQLVHGRATGARAARNDEATLEWSTQVDNRVFGIGRRDVVWQPALKHLQGADLVIVEHANRQLLNYRLLLRRRPRLAFWGHGGNLQAANRDSSSERLKRWVGTKPDWWFAYTEGSADRVALWGFPKDRITVVGNSTDTSVYEPLRVAKIPGRAVFVGGLDESKRLPYLLEAAEHLAARDEDFSLVVIGDGPQRPLIQDAAKRFEWLQYRGRLFGSAKAAELAAAQLLLMPGLVGLVAIDSFAARAPILTVDAETHSPEFEYLVNGVNAVVVGADASTADYAARAGVLLRESNELSRLRDGCQESLPRHSLARMVDNFVQGIGSALGASGKGSPL